MYILFCNNVAFEKYFLKINVQVKKKTLLNIDYLIVLIKSLIMRNSNLICIPLNGKFTGYKPRIKILKRSIAYTFIMSPFTKVWDRTSYSDVFNLIL